MTDLFGKVEPKVICVFSPCRSYRYVWSMEWPDAPPRVGDQTGRLMFCGLNPSRADEKVGDRTVCKLVGYARRWGYGALDVVNFAALRSTDPRELYRCAEKGYDPVGPDNSKWIAETAEKADMVLVGWGRHPGKLKLPGENRDWLVRLTDLVCLYDPVALGVNKDGSPVHPLYQRNDDLPYFWYPQP